MPVIWDGRSRKKFQKRGVESSPLRSSENATTWRSTSQTSENTPMRCSSKKSINGFSRELNRGVHMEQPRIQPSGFGRYSASVTTRGSYRTVFRGRRTMEYLSNDFLHN